MLEKCESGRLSFRLRACHDHRFFQEIQRLSQRLAESEMYSAKNSVVISVFEKCCWSSCLW